MFFSFLWPVYVYTLLHRCTLQRFTHCIYLWSLKDIERREKAERRGEGGKWGRGGTWTKLKNKRGGREGGEGRAEKHSLFDNVLLGVTPDPETLIETIQRNGIQTNILKVEVKGEGRKEEKQAWWGGRDRREEFCFLLYNRVI